MNTLGLQENRNVIQGKRKPRWIQLNDDDLNDSEEQNWFRRIQRETGETREFVEKAVDEDCVSCRSPQ
jgi:hypothetical protein